ncbi:MULTISPECIES: ABC transporter substrate-binding protein [Clostridium]|uniref:ABC transporter substrate-binding protein n=1 Tax=Clostridium lapidicellarium TaxID=3240931 RepID=A0ABV4DTU6_9CLOT|nr:extracellular solute-binding protein [uncultured Clostridium sp.]NLU08883.1 extracellular solute-binding protein [Clostridiales bacterium]
MNKCTKVILSLTSVIILIFAASCSKNQSARDDGKALHGNIEVVTDTEHGPQLKLAADKFNEIHKKSKVDVIVVKDTDNNVRSILDNYRYHSDILTVSDSCMKHVLSAYSDKILKMTNSVNSYKNNLLGDKVSNDTMKGSLYALPWDTYPKAIVYRKDIFYQEGVDVNNIKTWSDYIEVGRKIKKNTGGTFMGNVSDCNDNIFLLLANQLGTSYFNESGKLGFKSQKWARVMELAKIFYGEDLIKDFDSKSALIDGLNENKVLSFIADPTYIKLLMNTYPKDNYKWSIMKLPAFEPGGNRDASLGGTNLVINKNTKQANLAQAFINFALTDNKLQLDLLNQYGRFPVYTTAYNFVDFNKRISYFNDRVWDLFARVEEGSFGINYTKNFPQIRDKISKVLTGINIKNQNLKNIEENIEIHL